jgi:hypothetical protein
MNVDEARRDKRTSGINLAPTGTGDPTYVDDPPTLDSDVRRAGRPTQAIDNGARANHQIVLCHGRPLLRSVHLCPIDCRTGDPTV